MWLSKSSIRGASLTRARHIHTRHYPRTRVIQYSEALVMEPKGRGVPDTPHARGMTVWGCGILGVYSKAVGWNKPFFRHGEELLRRSHPSCDMSRCGLLRATRRRVARSRWLA